jgi:drug/metabolite transporter (DMT)-like permease
MAPLTLSAVLLAALLHAVWNAMIKISGDRLVIMTVTVAFTSLLALPFLFFLPLPTPESLPYLIISVFIHTIYMLLLVNAYGHGDFVQIYPLSRGSAPLFTALLGFVLLNEGLAPLELAGVFIVVGSILGLARERIGNISQLSRPALYHSILIGLCIATYSIVDGSGARLAVNAHSYTAWMFFCHSSLFPLITFIRRRGLLLSAVKQVWKPGLIVAITSATAYWIVIWAFSQERIAPVAVLRETSVVFAMLISAYLIKEPMNLRRVTLIMLIIIGIVLIGIG